MIPWDDHYASQTIAPEENFCEICKEVLSLFILGSQLLHRIWRSRRYASHQISTNDDEIRSGHNGLLLGVMLSVSEQGFQECIIRDFIGRIPVEV